MWCYQNPDFEALLITELQRQQQQYSQFCDTLLEAEGVLVPVHGCLLSAFSPCVSSALSSASPPPAGQKYRLTFGTLRTCTLLHIVRLLYSGEMEGEGEKERQEALSAAAKLGIHGLLEVTKRAWRRVERTARCAEAAVQTEPEGEMVHRGRWRREVRGGDVFLWKEAAPEGRQDVGTQTEAPQVDVAPPPPQTAASYQTIDIDVFQSLAQADSQLFPPRIVPVSIVYPADGNRAAHPLISLQDSASSAVALQPTSAPPPQTTPGGAEPQNGWAASRAAAEDEGCEYFEQFEGNIPGFISYFFDPHKAEGPGRRRGRGRGGARRGGTRARRPRGRGRGRGGGRGRGTLTQTVDMQEIVAAGRQFLHRSGGRADRVGQGGGAAGRRLQTKTRELLNSGASLQRRRVPNKVWEVNQTGDLQLCRKVGRRGRGGKAQRGRKSSASWHEDVDAPSALPSQRSSSVSFSRSPVRVLRVSASPAPGSALPCPTPPGHQHPAGPYVCPAASLLHTCPLPPPACPPQDEQPEHIDRLLEEVMMGLDILPISTSTPHPAHSAAAAASEETLSANKQLCHTDALCRSLGVAHQVRETAVSCPADGAVPVLQQEGDGEMNKMLDRFLQTFERHIERTWVEKAANEEGCAGGGSSVTLNRDAVTHTPQPQDPRPPEGETRHLSRKQTPRLFEEKTAKETSSRDVDKGAVDRNGMQQLQWTPVVKLKRSLLLPTGVTLLDSSCQILTQKVRTKTDAAAKDAGKEQSPLGARKTYSTRSRFKEMSPSCNVPVVEEPLKKERLSSAGLSSVKRERPRENRLHTNPSSSSNRNKKESSLQAEVKGKQPKKRGRKRRAVPNGKPGDVATPTKRVCVDQTAQAVCETASPKSKSVEFCSEAATVEPQEIIDVETVSLASEGDESLDRKLTFLELALTETEEGLIDEQSTDSSNEIIDVETLGGETDEETSRDASAPEFRPKSPGSSSEEKEEGVDVIGGCSPSPEPVGISWTDCSDGEKEDKDGDEDVDVDVEETTD